jgi:protocatechuate 3,4-dioxygenase beta subunit
MKFALILACVCAAAPQSFAFQSGAGSIEGQVVSLATGAPVRRAAVYLTLASPRPFRPGQPPQQYQPAAAETDDRGSFVFRDLAPGSYRLSAQKQGFAGGNNPSYQQGSQLYLGDRQQLKGVVVKLAPQSVIVGKVFDRNGDPLERAQVSILRWQYWQGGPQWMPMNSVQTNDLGEYRISGMATGQYRLSATYHDYRTMQSFNQAPSDKPEMTYVTTYYGDTPEVEKAQYVTVSSGTETHADIRMQMSPTVRIRGRVVDAAGPVANQMAMVSVVPKTGPAGAMFGGGTSAGVNRPSGDFELSGIASGEYYLVARRTGPSPAGGGVMGAVQPITVADKPIEGVVLTLASGRDVEGTVQIEGDGRPSLGSLTIQANSVDGLSNGMPPQVRWSGSQFTLPGVAPGRTSITVNNPPRNYYVKSIQYQGKEVPQGGADLTTGGSLVIVLSEKGAHLAGRVMDAAGKAAARAVLALYSAGNQPPRYYQSVSDSNGEFRFPVLPAGEYKLLGWESSNETSQVGEFARQFDSRAKTVKLEAGGDVVADVTVIPATELQAAAGVSTLVVEFARTKASVEGQVVNAKTGQPVKNALVRLNAGMSGAIFSTNVNGNAVRPPGSVVTVETDGLGNFTFRDVDPGVYQLGAERQGFINGLFGRQPDMNSDPLIVGDGQDLSKVVLRLAPQAVVAGKVTDEYGDPVVNIPVSVYARVPRAGGGPNPAPRSANTNSLGEYRIAALASGTYVLAVRPTPPLTTAELAALPLPEQPEMRNPVTYYPASLDPEGAKPIVLDSGAEVTGIDMKLRKTAAFQIRGRITGLPAAPAAATEHVVTLPGVTPRGRAGRGAVVMLYPAKALAGLTLPAGSVSVRPDGSFTIAGVLPGAYLLTARSPAVNQDHLSAAVLPIEVKDKHLDGIRVELKPASDVKASVEWEKATSVPLNWFYVNLQSAYPTGSGSSGQMEGENAMTFRNVLAIPYKVANVNLPPNCSCFLKSIRYGGREIPEGGADLTTGQPFEIVLSSSAAIVEGTVVDRQGKPVAGAALALAPKDSSLAKVRTGFADERGKFLFENNPPGEYRLLAWEDVNPAALNDASFLDRFDASATLVKLEALGRQTVRPVAIPAQ